MNNLEIPKFWSPPWTAPPSGSVFSGRVLKIKILLQTFFFPRLLVSIKVLHDHPAPKP